ncbi:AAA family ATPase [Sphaerisporangium dianthi]|uniref:AAA family ATPase n=1 Tax=Sphaerisporangium dianthi TaxID=1436120 RepID=A0ABV9CFC9_9ACTN
MGRTVPFLRRVRVTNYKSIASCEVAFSSLLVLLGPNGAGKSNFVDALRFVADALNTTPADAVAKRGGLNEVLRQAPDAADEFTIHVEFVIQAAGKPSLVEYAFAIGRDSTGRRPLLVKEEHCVIRHDQDDSRSKEIRFDTRAGLILGGGGIERDRLYLPLAATQEDFSNAYHDLRDMLFHHLDIEEPAAALHPAAAGALFDALTEASERVQVVITTQSADLLDRDDVDPDSVRVVSMTDGITLIGEIDEVSRRLLQDRRTTLGELMRGGQLRPGQRMAEPIGT